MTTNASAALPAAAGARKPARASLARDLEQMGFRVIPDGRVEQHKSAVIAARRPGALKYWAPVLRLLTLALHVTSLEIFLNMAAEKVSERTADRIMFVCILLSAIMGGTFLGGNFVLAGAICFTPFVSIVIMLVMMATFSAKLHTAINAHWELADFDTFAGANYVPMQVREKAAQAKLVPNARVQIERLEEDPFLAVVRGRGLSRQIVRIAAWDTGDPFLNHFAS
ncbi:MAG: hypothetical protein JWL75_44 [Parcubacteria group bacterium]|nr:hypothetical protein [Parcubacteria group bacterium]